MASWKFWKRTGRKRLRRTWFQRGAVVSVFVASLLCFLAAGGLGAAQWVVSQRQLVTLDSPSDEITVGQNETSIVTPDGSIVLEPVQGDGTIDLVEPGAANFLLTGADSGTCDDQGDDAGLGTRTDGGRSDTIMLWRVNPESNRLAVLSFPRDLYVDRPGGFRSKINAAYKENDPSELVDTLYLNFGIPVDHYVQVDLCAFKTLVDAVDGVAINFDTSIRDVSTGIAIYEPGCVNLDGDAALAYVRSRKLQVYDEASGTWQTDGTGDLGRISRQQDFVRQLIGKVIDEGLYSPSAASGLIETNREYLVTDSGLTVNRMLEFANTLREVDTADIASYQIESYSDNVGGASVQRMSISGDNMQAILQVFRGQALLSDAPVQEFVADDVSTTVVPSTVAPTTAPDSTTPDSSAPDSTAPDEPTAPDSSTPDSAPPTTVAPSSTTLPTVFAEQDTIGIVPVSSEACT